MICSLYDIDGVHVQTFTKFLDDGEVHFKLYTASEPRYDNPTYDCNAKYYQAGHCPACGRHLCAKRIDVDEYDDLLDKQGETLSSRNNRG